MEAVMEKYFDDSVFDEFGDNEFDIDIDDRDRLYLFTDSIDWRAQLIAVRLMLSRNREAREAFSQAIEDDKADVLAYDGPYHWDYVDRHVDMLHESVYRDAAESMAAIGMIAPMVESTLGQIFFALGDMYERKKLSPRAHKRWIRAGVSRRKWDFQCFFNEKKEEKDNIVLGMRQISGASGLDKFLSDEFITWFEAMFTYRNYMFHGGFEWGQKRRDAFEKKIDTCGWPFFSCSTSGGRPWIYYLRNETIDAMPTMVENMLDSIGRFAKSLPFELISE
jgi:hypothetical protein